MLDEWPVRVSRRTGRALVDEEGTVDREALPDDDACTCPLIGEEFPARNVELDDWLLLDPGEVRAPAVLGEIRGRAVVDAVGVELEAVIGGVSDVAVDGAEALV